MHASTVGPAFESSVTAGDLRTEAAKSRAESRAAAVPVPGDLRTEAAKEPLVPPGLPAYPSPVEPPVPPGLPTFPTATEPLAPPASQPTAATDGGDDWFGWPLAGLIAAGVLALGGAALAARHQLRGQAGTAH
jgi:hypothetical protein